VGTDRGVLDRVGVTRRSEFAVGVLGLVVVRFVGAVDRVVAGRADAARRNEFIPVVLLREGVDRVVLERVVVAFRELGA
jgi:hypothetical protein